MSESSGNLKLIVGALLGALVAAAVVSMTTHDAGAPAARPPAEVKAPKPEAAVVAPPPVPATQAKDWRARVEVGESAPPQPTPVAVPTTKSEIRALLRTLAERVGGQERLKELTQATWEMTLHQGDRELPFTVELDGAAGLRLTDPTQALVAVWSRDGSCQERRGSVEGPCHPMVAKLSESVYGAHLAHVVAFAGRKSVRPVRVKSGMGARVPWTVLTFKLSKSRFRVVTGIDTRAVRTRVSLTTMRFKDWRPMDGDEKPEATESGDKIEIYPGLALRTVTVASAWRAYAGGVRLPSRFCRTLKTGVPDLIDSEGGQEEACEVEFKLVRVTAGISKNALKLSDGDELAVSARGQHLFMKVKVTDANLAQQVDRLRKELPKERFVRHGTFFMVDGADTLLCEEMRTRGPRTHELPSRPRVVSLRVTKRLSELPAAFSALEQRAKKAGFEPIAGPRLARPDTRAMPVPGKPLPLLLELPIAP